MRRTVEDLTILANIYSNLLNKEQLEYLLYVMESPGNMNYMAGSYPLGMFFVYNFPDIFEEHRERYIKKDTHDPTLIPDVAITTSKYLLKREIKPNNNRPTEKV